MTTASPARSALADWRLFAGRFRKYAAVGVSQAVVASLAGDGLTIPLLLTLGCPPALATAIGALPVTGSIAQLGIPWLLRRAGGNLRRVTLAILCVGEMRGFILAGVTLLASTHAITNAVAIVAIAAVMGIAGAAGTIGGTNLQAWYGAVLSENDRRFVAPRVVATILGLGAVLLLPVALLVQATSGRLGITVYAGVFVVSGIAGVVELACVRRLRHPGRVLVHAEGDTGSTPSPTSLTRFLRIITLAAFGAGFGPYFSIYAISILHMPASYAILLSALSSASALAASTVIGGWLHRGSASRLLRLSLLLRGGSVLAGLLAFPANPAAPLILCVMAVFVNAGLAAGVLGSNERLLRLATGGGLIRAQGRFVAGTAVGLTSGQFLSAGVLATLPVGFAAFAILFAVSGLFRIVLIPFVEVSESWSTATGAWSVDELQGETRREGPEGPAS